MPLLDHFRPPVADVHRWESFHSNWATRIADALNDKLPADFLAEENTHAGGRLEIDVATYETGNPDRHHANGVAVAETVYAPPVPAVAVPVSFPDSFEVRVYAAVGGLTLVGVVELVSPANKDRPDERAAFAAKTAGFLHRGVSVVLVDVVTTRRANLHNETLRFLQADDSSLLPDDAHCTPSPTGRSSAASGRRSTSGRTGSNSARPCRRCRSG